MTDYKLIMKRHPDDAWKRRAKYRRVSLGAYIYMHDR